MSKFIPTKSASHDNNKLPGYILEMISSRNKTRKRWQRTRNTYFRNELNIKTHAIRREIQKYRNEIWTNKLTKLNVNDNSLWRMTKIFKSDFQPISALKKANITAVTDKEKAEMLASQYQQVHDIDIINNTNEQNEIINNVKNFINKCNIEHEWNTFITSPKEIRNEIKKLPSCKAPGIDKIQNIVLKNLCGKAIV